MFNKILVWGWLALTAVLVIENMVMNTYAFILWDNTAKTWALALVCTIVWAAIWFWFKWMLTDNWSQYDESEF